MAFDGGTEYTPASNDDISFVRKLAGDRKIKGARFSDDEVELAIERTDTLQEAAACLLREQALEEAMKGNFELCACLNEVADKLAAGPSSMPKVSVVFPAALPMDPNSEV